MGGATIQCGSFEGNDKSASPITSVLDEAFFRAFGRLPRSRFGIWFAKYIGSKPTSIEAAAEAAIIDVKFNEKGEISPEIASLLLPHLEQYQSTLLLQLGIKDDADEIEDHMNMTTDAKYGTVPDRGWHLYCLHDLVPACRISVRDGCPIQVIW